MTFLLLLPGFYERKKSVWVVEMYQNALKKNSAPVKIYNKITEMSILKFCHSPQDKKFTNLFWEKMDCCFSITCANKIIFYKPISLKRLHENQQLSKWNTHPYPYICSIQGMNKYRKQHFKWICFFTKETVFSMK